MGLFKRKEKTCSEIPPSPPPECQHLWKDFPWYFKSEYSYDYSPYYNRSNGNLSIKIYEPYVCVKCKERKDVILEEFSLNNQKNLSGDKAIELVQGMKEKYSGYWSEPAIVEDMIKDFQMVDRRALRWLGYMKQFGQEDDLKLVFERANGEKIEVKLGEE